MADFTWDPSIRRYRRANGRFLRRSDMQDLVDARIKRAQNELKNSVDDLIEGRIGFGQFQRYGRDRLRVIHSQSLILGAGGVDRVEPEEFLKLGRYLKNQQYPYWRRFMGQIAEGKIAPSVAKYRLAQYARSAKVSLAAGEGLAAESSGMAYMRRYLSPVCAPHCPECLTYAAAGAVLRGALPLPGVRCSCNVNCCCRVRYFKTELEAQETA